jgi:hypothetical protein
MPVILTLTLSEEEGEESLSDKVVIFLLIIVERRGSPVVCPYASRKGIPSWLDPFG